MTLNRIWHQVPTSNRNVGRTSRHEEMTRIQQLEAQQRKYTLDRERATINEVTIEQLVLLSGIHNSKTS